MDSFRDISDQDERAKQKQLSRDRDAACLEGGEVSLDQLKHENDFFSAVPIKRFKIVAIGGKRLRRSI